MKKGFKKIVAWVCAVTLMAAGLTGYQAKNVSAATALVDDTATRVGVWSLYAGLWNGAGNGAMSYEGEGATVDDLTVIIDSSSGTSGSWAIQAVLPEYNAGLTVGTVYDMTIEVTTTKAGNLHYQIDGVGTTVGVEEGENTITKQITYTGAKSDVVFELSGMPVGAQLTFNEVSFVEATEIETTVYNDGAVLVSDANVTKDVPAYESGDLWQNEYNHTDINYIAGKNYVAEVVVSSDVNKTIKLVFQRIGVWDFVDAAGGYEYEIKAGEKVKITYVFNAAQGTDNGNFDIYLGSVADAATLVFESKTLTTYTTVPDGVVTGVEVLEAGSEEENTTVPEETTAPSTGEDPYAGLTWKQVGTTDYYVAAANDEFPINTLNDHTTRMEIVPGVAEGTKPIWPAFSNETLNGVAGTYAVGAGIFIDYAALNMNAYNIYQANSAIDSHTFQIIIKAGTPTAGGEEPTTEPVTDPSGVVNVAINAVEQPAGQINATWTNPSVEYTKQACYLNKAGVEALDEAHYAKAANGYVWSDHTEIRTGLDTVAGTKDGTISLADGGSFVIVVQYFDADGNVVAQGTSNTVTIVKNTNTNLALFVERYDQGAKTAFLKWSAIGGATRYVIYDENGTEVGASTGDWGSVVVPAYDQDYTYTVKAFDGAGNEIAITNSTATANCSYWIVLGNGIGEGGDGYSYNVDHTAKEVVNVQKPNWSDAGVEVLKGGIYMNVSSGISEVSVNGVTGDSVTAILGSGVIVYLSALTKNINEIVITHAEGTAEVKIKNDNVSADATEVDIKIAGWQIAAGTLNVNGNTYDGGVRTVYSINAEADDKATERGLIYGLGGYAAEGDMVIDSTSGYVAKMKASDAGKIDDTYAGVDGQLYAMIMASNLSSASINALKQEYMVRAYVIVDDTVYYSDVATYSTVEVAQYLYNNGSMQTADGHAYICALINRVYPETATKEFELVTPPVVKPSDDVTE